MWANSCTWLSEARVLWLFPIRYRSNKVERNSWSWITGTLGHSQEAWLYFSILQTFSAPFVCMRHLAKCNPRLPGVKKPLRNRKRNKESLRPQGKTNRHSSLVLPDSFTPLHCAIRTFSKQMGSRCVSSQYGCSRCAEAVMQMGKWTTVYLNIHLGWAGAVFLACYTYLYLSVCPSYHQLLRQSQLAIETMDGLFCFLFEKGTSVSQTLKMLN